MRKVLGQFIFNIKYSDSLCIFLKENNQDLKFAASELKKYIKLAYNMEIRIVGADSGQHKGALVLCICKDNLADCDKNDEFSITVEAGNLVISGSNKRSLLYGVYKFLEQYIGYKWTSPEYEFIPSKVPGLIYIHSNNYKPDFSERELVTKYSGLFWEGGANQIDSSILENAAV